MYSKYILIITTCATENDAKIIISELLNKKLAACIQTNKVTSHYAWKDKNVCEKEISILIKTKIDMYKKIEETILSVHKYEVPEIIQIPIENGYHKYLNWINTIVL